MVLLLVGTIALMPPFAGIFRIDGTVAGIPFPLFCLFVIWALLIAGAAALSRPLRDGDDAIRSAEAGDTER